MSNTRIFIDPGHGGRDPGAVANGMRESDIVLEVSQHLALILERAGIEVRLSRTTDTDITINQRWQAANTWNATHFVSIHANAGGGTGVETLIPTASPNNPSRDLQANRRFAEIISNELANTFNMRARRANGVMLETETRHGNIGVLRNTRMLAILPEIAFLDSPLSNPDVEILRHRRQDIAQSIANGIFRFLGVNPSQAPQEPPQQVTSLLPGHIPSEWATAAWLWAMESGLTDGTRPRDNITRQEVMQLFRNFYTQMIKPQ